MVDLSRRFFLGGAISLIAATQFTPSVNAMNNLPVIYGNGRDDDTDGLRALFCNDPVVFKKKDMVAVDGHHGVTFCYTDYPVSFKVTRMISVPKELNLNFEKAHFNGIELENDEPFFKVETGELALKFCGPVTYDVKGSHHSKFIIGVNEEGHSFGGRRISDRERAAFRYRTIDNGVKVY